MPKRALPALFLAVAVLLAGRTSRADEQRDLDKVRAAYLGHQYDVAEYRLRALLDPKTGTLHDPALVTQARMYLAAVLLANNEEEPANTVLERLLLDNPQYDPDPLSFPTNVIDFFIDARARLRDKLNADALKRARIAAEKRAQEEELRKREAARIAMLERMAAEEKITWVHSRWVAFVPFGVGQFQNGKPALGWAFLGAEAALVVGTMISVPLYLGDLQGRSDAYRAGDNFTAQEYVNRANTVFDVNLVLVGALAVTAVTGIVEAQINYVPTRVEVRKRSVPTGSWTLAPSLTPVDGGGVVGVRGVF